MQKSIFKCVICTSTLAQGVNLPIKDLIISTNIQGGEEIKVKTFHNLIGRAGRSGKHTEGTIIFTDPRIYKSKGSINPYHWNKAKRLLNSDNLEECRSKLFHIFTEEPTDPDKKKKWLHITIYTL